MTKELTIEALGHLGDGITSHEGKKLHVALTLPGETVRVREAGKRLRAVEIITKSPQRVEAPCSYFGECGGCQMQHVAPSAYRDWKLELLKRALSSENLDVEIAPLEADFSAKRRRVSLTAIKANDRVVMGYQEKGSHRVTNISECLVMDDAIQAQFSALRQIAEPLLPKRGSIRLQVLACENGLDVHVETEKDGKGARNEASRVALRHGFARLAINDETVLFQRKPVIKSGDLDLFPFAAGFVQANQHVQDQMAALVVDHLKGCNKIADLFAGIGTFAMPLALHAPVVAAESHAPSLAALEEAWKAAGGTLKEIDCQRRDLFVRPFMVEELKKIDGIAIDPPRAGAKAQFEQIADSNVSRIASVSCNPASFARDLKIATEAGFKLTLVKAFDQFAYTPHLEMVALLER